MINWLTYRMVLKFTFHKLVYFSCFFAFFSQQAVFAESDTLEETISSGSRTFQRFCSTCHGADAKGDGPFSANLLTTPPDLTLMSRNNGGTFPWMKTYKAIDGKNIPKAHGSTTMPIWGEMFDLRNWGSGYTEYADVIVRGRIFEVIVYLQYIQEEES